MKKARLFTLEPKDRFIMDETKYTVKYYKYKNMPTLGRVLRCVCFNDKGEIQCFIRNWEVELIK